MQAVSFRGNSPWPQLKLYIHHKLWIIHDITVEKEQVETPETLPFFVMFKTAF